ncbi:MAG: hypothetical protein MJ150_02310 [Clostridia bacterium]|nr:hypothetical protein [Clostridia bacterium]
MNKILDARQFKKVAVILAIIIIELIFFGYAVSRANNTEKNAGRQVLEDALRKAALNCYVTEGFYPPSLEYMEDKYGLIIDNENYVIHYSVFASNIMPEISVFGR